MRLFKKLNSRGFSHGMMLLAFMVIFGIGGVAWMVYTKAAEPSSWRMDEVRSTNCEKIRDKLCAQKDATTQIVDYRNTKSLKADYAQAIKAGLNPGTYQACFQVAFGDVNTYSAYPDSRKQQLRLEIIPVKVLSDGWQSQANVSKSSGTGPITHVELKEYCTQSVKVNPGEDGIVMRFYDEDRDSMRLHVNYVVLKKLGSTASDNRKGGGEPTTGGSGGNASCESQTFRKGDKGDCVKTIQTKLNGKGYSLGVDGDFGTNTDNAVRDFQSKNGLTVDGVVGPGTWSKLNSSGSSGGGTTPATGSGKIQGLKRGGDTVISLQKEGSSEKTWVDAGSDGSFAFNNLAIPATYIVRVNGASGYNVSWTACAGKVGNCHNTPDAKGSGTEAKVYLGSGYIDLWWDYTKTTTSTPGPAPSPTAPRQQQIRSALRPNNWNMCLDVTAGNTGEGASVQLYQCNSNSQQKWTVNPNGTILAWNGKCLDGDVNNPNNHSAVRLYTCNGGTQQKWSVNSNGSVCNTHPNMRSLCLDATGGSSASNGAPIQLYQYVGGDNQRWSII